MSGFLTCAVLLSLAACVEAPFRTGSLDNSGFAIAQDNPCTEVHALGAANREIQSRDKHACGLQHHVLPIEMLELPDETVVTDGELQHFQMAMNAWTVAAAQQDPPRALASSDSYTLAFLEMDAKGNATVPTQAPELQAHLAARKKAGQQNIVVVYVHGWRHDAAIRDGDAVKFRRVLGYTRAALNARCIEAGTYCDAALTGIFVGWPGRLINEGFTDDRPNRGVGFRVGSLSALASFWDRYNLSCRLGSGANCHPAPVAARDAPLRRILTEIEGTLRLRPGNPAADKMLVLGHSLGGNMLATMLRADVEKAVSRHQPGSVMRPPVGDLVVLINPASSAENWTGIQRAERKRAGLGQTNVLSCFRQGQECFDAYWTAIRRWSGLYPVSQRPVYVSLTSSDNWGTLLNRDNPDYDTATDRVFQLAQLAQGFEKEDREKVVTIGHLMPRYADRFTLQPGTDPVGATHEMAVLESAGGRANTVFSTYANATRPDTAWCAASDGWLAQARRVQDGDSRAYVTNWDYGLLPKRDGQTRLSRNVGGLQNPSSIRWRQSVRYTNDIDGLSVGPGTTPFWNVRALDTAIRGHAGWANYPTWCAITQLVLDDATAEVAAPTVRRVFDALSEPVVDDIAVADEN